jgi:SAM-dependent MidA family methyltransferase
MVDPQNFIDQMLGTENLTDALEDEQADFLLHWGVVQLKQKLAETEDSEAAGEYTNALMGFMRTLNQIAGDPENIQPESLVQLAERRNIAFGAARKMAEDAFSEEAAQLKAMTPQQAIEYLLQDKE